jgi:WD40 repeat protein
MNVFSSPRSLQLLVSSLVLLGLLSGCVQQVQVQVPFNSSKNIVRGNWTGNAYRQCDQTNAIFTPDQTKLLSFHRQVDISYSPGGGVAQNENTWQNLWDVSSGQKLGRYTNLNGEILGWTPNNELALERHSQDYRTFEMLFWNLSSQQLDRTVTLKAGLNPIDLKREVSRDYTRFFSHEPIFGTPNLEARVFDLKSQSITHRFRFAPPNNVAVGFGYYGFSKDDSKFVVVGDLQGSNSSQVYYRVWDSSTRQILQQSDQLPAAKVRQVALSPTGQQIAVLTDSNLLLITNGEVREVAKVPDNSDYQYYVQDFSFNADGTEVIATVFKLEIWNLATGAYRKEPTPKPSITWRNESQIQSAGCSISVLNATNELLRTLDDPALKITLNLTARYRDANSYDLNGTATIDGVALTARGTGFAGTGEILTNQNLSTQGLFDPILASTSAYLELLDPAGKVVWQMGRPRLGFSGNLATNNSDSKLRGQMGAVGGSTTPTALPLDYRFELDAVQ